MIGNRRRLDFEGQVTPWHGSVRGKINNYRGNFHRKALRALGMRDERFVNVSDLLGRRDRTVTYLEKIMEGSVDEWSDRRSHLTRRLTHDAVRMFEVADGFVDLAYGAVFLPSGELIVESTVWEPLRFLLNSPLSPVEGSTAFLENFSVVPTSGFYHFVIEDFPRLAWIRQAFPDRGFVLGHDMSTYGEEVAQQFGAEVKNTTARYLRVKNYPFVAFDSASGWPSRATVEFVRSQSDRWFVPNRGESELKVYVSRLGHSRSPLNEEEVLGLVRSQGYLCVDAANLTLKDQMKLFSNASTIAGVHGAGLTNLIWMQSGGRVVEIMDPFYYNSCFQWLSEVRGLDHRTVINCQETPRRVDLDALAEQL